VHQLNEFPSVIGADADGVRREKDNLLSLPGRELDKQEGHGNYVYF
jgi:hypothetical protein